MAKRYLMQARDDTAGTVHYWVNATGDETGYTGPNAATELAVVGTHGTTVTSFSSAGDGAYTYAPSPQEFGGTVADSASLTGTVVVPSGKYAFISMLVHAEGEDLVHRVAKLTYFVGPSHSTLTSSEYYIDGAAASTLTPEITISASDALDFEIENDSGDSQDMSVFAVVEYWTGP